ncbi:hypothetical protein AADG42_05625 [Ammonicoccus fulvus]|uniref:Uncharacterized protein n=1 Tax=Ammonicoccus fulvus TaxID=3138240 RepID=A0ABZ3FL87_9ACTN
MNPKCHSKQCEPAAILEAVGLTVADRYDGPASETPSDPDATGRTILAGIAHELGTVSTPAAELEVCHATFRKWLGPEYDLDSLDAVLCAAAVQKLDGDPLWLLVVSGSGNS